MIDHGAGIDKAERQQIFLPFYQADSSCARHGEGGAGLGLAVTQQIAHEHHGSVTVSPTTGGGSTFTLLLPHGRQEADT